MVSTDEDALICDFAETYHIYAWRKLPARTAATLAAGLSPDSRIMRKLSGVPAKLEHILLAIIADACTRSVWQFSQAAAEGAPSPPSLYKTLFGGKNPSRGSGFDDGAAFDQWRENMMRREQNGK